MLSTELMEIVACPACLCKLDPLADTFSLHCNGCGCSYQIIDGIPVLLWQQNGEPDAGGQIK